MKFGLFVVIALVISAFAAHFLHAVDTASIKKDPFAERRFAGVNVGGDPDVANFGKVHG